MSGRPKGQPKSGGRQKGTLNKATKEIKTAAQKHGAEAVRILAKLMTSADSDSAKISACKELLDRGYGKSAQAITGAEGAPLMPPIIQFVLDENPP